MTEKNIIKNPADISKEQIIYSEADMKQDVSFCMAEIITKGLLDKGEITPEEYEKIMTEHIKNFSPTLAPILL